MRTAYLPSNGYDYRRGRHLMHVTPRAIAGCIGKQSFDSSSAGCCVMCELGEGSSMDFA
jgi:hypothetical protein